MMAMGSRWIWAWRWTCASLMGRTAATTKGTARRHMLGICASLMGRMRSQLVGPTTAAGGSVAAKEARLGQGEPQARDDQRGRGSAGGVREREREVGVRLIGGPH